jgi:hypothetical protein
MTFALMFLIERAEIESCADYSYGHSFEYLDGL